MGSQRFLGYLLFLIMEFLFTGSSIAYKFYVGGRDGWVLNPSENYSQWAQRNRFQVNDTLFFKYKKGSDSVLIVNKENYNSCNTKSNIQNLTDGDSIFKFNNSGPFYFISGYGDNCNKGQKLIIIVMAVRQKSTPGTPAYQSPSPLAAPPTSSASLPPSPAESTSDRPSDPNAPEPSPSRSGSESFTGFVGLVLGACIWVSVILG